MAAQRSASMSHRRAAILAALAGASLLDIALVAVRMAYADQQDASLAWNLFLAWVPLALALLVYDSVRRNGPRLALVPAALAWLLFFPNAPYIATDFVHLHAPGGVPFWLDAITIGACAATGVLLGFVSLALMHAVAQHIVGPVTAWAFVGFALMLGSVGIYLGRVLRLNSWDAFTQPAALLDLARLQLADPFGHATSIAVVVMSVALLLPAYLAFYAVARPTLELKRP